ncbi:MAG: SoxR reducing system RseC family protein [Clostridia bacterium]|nr:SoxR reducing system RseC family protein [Clostridia bacterium]
MAEGELRQTGRVIELKNELAVVRFQRSDACGHCNACFHFGSTEADIEIENTCDAVVGDIVTIELHSGSMFKASAIAYGIPLIGLIVGAALGSRIGDIYAAVGGMLLCGGTFFILRGLNPRFDRMREFKPRMIAIVGHEDQKAE